MIAEENIKYKKMKEYQNEIFNVIKKMVGEENNQNDILNKVIKNFKDKKTTENV